MSEVSPPRAAIRQHAITTHGQTRQDPYFWLRAENWQEVMRDPSVLAPDIKAYLDAENAWFESEFGAKAEALKDRIFKEIRGRIKEDDSGVPTPDGPFAYNSRMAEGKQYPLLVRTPRGGGDEEVLLDCNFEAGEGYFGFGGGTHDRSHRYLAWAADRNGSEYYTIVVRDLSTGEELPDRIEKSAGSMVWSADSASIFYVELDDNHRPYQVRRHVIGTAQSVDEIVYTETDAGFFVELGETLSGKYITIGCGDHQTSEIWLIDAENPGTPRLVSARQIGREYEIDEHDGQLLILTNADGAEDFKIVSVSAEAPASENWRDLVPHVAGTLILSNFAIKNRMVRLERHDGLPRIVIHDLRNGQESAIAFDEQAYALGVSSGFEFNTTEFRFSYSSPTTPQQTYDFDVESGERTLRKTQEVPSGHDPAQYVTRRIMAPADDGELVPVTILMHKDTSLDGSAPCLLYGYGAYGISMPAGFSIANLSLVDRGMIYAVAHVRGGKDKGYRWYANGRREHKQNSFTDFIAAADFLIAEGFTSERKIVAEGGSAGGMLMGAIANLRPDLFAGIIAQVPFVDVLNTMLDDSLPLTPPEWPEWGNPNASKADFDLISAYSPYDNISAREYPPIFALAGLTDPRVTYWEPAKWVAKLRASKTDSNPLYLKTNMEAGHGGASGRFDRLKETALTQAFALWVTGIEQIGADDHMSI